MSKILGFAHLEPFASYFHDTNVGLVGEGVPRFGALEERFSRVKHHAGFPVGALAAIHRVGGVTLSRADVIAVAENREPQRPAITNGAAPVFDLERLAKPLKLTGDVFRCDHQLAHASVAFRLSPFESALVVTLDGMGHDLGAACYGAVFEAEGNQLRRLKTCWSEGNSLGLFYGLVTEALGWRMSDGEGKVMALSTSGDPERVYEAVRVYAPEVRGGELIGGRLFSPSVSIVNHQQHIAEPAIGELAALAERHGRTHLAAAAQRVLEDVVVSWISALLSERRQTKRICLGGGVFLNVSLNTRLMERFPDIEFFVPSNPADGGIGLGAALEAAARVGHAKPPSQPFQYMGAEYDPAAALTHKSDWGGIRLDHPFDRIASCLERGEVIGLHQGRSEWGPRALGNRSVLAHPGFPGVRDRINALMKRREMFMPFAPVVMEEYVGDWFDGAARGSPYMMFTFRAKAQAAASIPAVLHIDQTARIQTVRADQNAFLHGVLDAFRARTGLPLLLNTSFNLHGLPMIETPHDALDHLQWGCIDRLFFADLEVSPR